MIDCVLFYFLHKTLEVKSESTITDIDSSHILFYRRDFAVKMGAALQENTSSTLKAINLSGNSVEDKGCPLTSHLFD